MLISERITQLIEEMLNEGGGITEIKRNEFANLIGCVPSQINYVITSRFNKERGYIVESRRGGGGYIRIIRPQATGRDYLYHLLNCIGNSIDSESSIYLTKDMYANGIISEREANIIISVLNNKSAFEFCKDSNDELRAEMFKSIILTVINFRQ